MKELADKVAVVTGAASGIGLAMAEAFAREGMRVVLADVDEAALATAERALTGRGARARAVRTDVSDPASVAALAEAAVGTFGGVHVVCNNAGVGGDGCPVWEQPLESWQWVLGVNLWGVIHGIRTFVPLMLEQGGEGHVVNTASMAGHVSTPYLSPYHVSKYGVVSMSESLHHELAGLGSSVKVSVLCPGFVRTAINDGERTRPAALKVERQPSEAEQAWREMFRTLVEGGIPPADVAARVVDAIRTERFWIFPHPELLFAIEERAKGILAERNPTLDVPLSWRGPTT